MTRVLITNDDGIDGEGLRVLVATLVARGYETLVVAPDEDYSGAGSSIINKSSAFSAGNRELPYDKRVLAEAPNVEAYAVGAPPAMCALLGVRGAFGDPPDVVASGINLGLNTGPAVSHSGTVAAALAAAANGVPAVAISAEHPAGDPEAALHYDTAAEVGIQLLKVLLETDHMMLNVNVPFRPIDDLAGIRSATVSTVNAWRSTVEEFTQDRLVIGYADQDAAMPAGSDTALVKSGFASVTSLAGVTSLPSQDVLELLGQV